MNVPIDAVLELYGDPRQTLESIARLFGVSVGSVQAALDAAPEGDLSRIKQQKADRIFEYGLAEMYREPDMILDSFGSKIDPAGVTLQRMRGDLALKYAGLLDRAKYSDKAQLEVSATGALADFLTRISQGGSTLPIVNPILQQPSQVIDVEPIAVHVSQTPLI